MSRRYIKTDRLTQYEAHVRAVAECYVRAEGTDDEREEYTSRRAGDNNITTAALLEGIARAKGWEREESAQP